MIVYQSTKESFTADVETGMVEEIISVRYTAKLNRHVVESEKRKKFALWNIVNMRWPMLVEYLEDHPDQIQSVFDSSNGTIRDEKIEKLMTYPYCKAVIDGQGIGAELDSEYIKRIIQMETGIK